MVGPTIDITSKKDGRNSPTFFSTRCDRRWRSDRFYPFFNCRNITALSPCVSPVATSKTQRVPHPILDDPIFHRARNFITAHRGFYFCRTFLPDSLFLPPPHRPAKASLYFARSFLRWLREITRRRVCVFISRRRRFLVQTVQLFTAAICSG